MLHRGTLLKDYGANRRDQMVHQDQLQAMTQMTTKMKGERTGEGRGQEMNITIPEVSKKYEHPGIVATLRGGRMTQLIRDSWPVHLLMRRFCCVLKQAELVLELIQALF